MMNDCSWLTLAIFVLGLVALLGFMMTKTQGFGRYSTSTLLLILVLVFSTLLYVSGKVDEQTLANLMFAIVGFAGGLFTSKDKSEPVDETNKVDEVKK
jgi:hypothetical protein